MKSIGKIEEKGGMKMKMKNQENQIRKKFADAIRNSKGCARNKSGIVEIKLKGK